MVSITDKQYPIMTTKNSRHYRISIKKYGIVQKMNHLIWFIGIIIGIIIGVIIGIMRLPIRQYAHCLRSL